MLDFCPCGGYLFCGSNGREEESERMLTRLLLIGIFIGGVLDAGEEAWPCFHGARRDNRSDETGLLTAWPEGGPKLLWSTAGIGHGYSSVAVAGGRIFTAGTIEKQTWLRQAPPDGRPMVRLKCPRVAAELSGRTRLSTGGGYICGIRRRCTRIR